LKYLNKYKVIININTHKLLVKMNTNNRFNVLIENKKPNVVKNNEPKTSTFNNFKSNSSGYKSSRHQDEVDYRMFKEEKNKKQKEEDIVKALDISNFPDLKSIASTTTSKNTKEKDKISFADMMKNPTQILEENNNAIHINREEEETVKPGWVCIKQDNKTKQPIWVYDKGCINEVPNENNFQEEDPYYAFERLVTQYQKRKNEYIKNWGYEEYDKMFLFQNYDYEYFDNIDENYDDFYKISNTSDYEYSSYNYVDYINN